MAFDINNFVIDRIVRGTMTSSSDGSMLWSVNQLTNPKLSITSDTAEAKDAVGNTISTFNRGKKAQFTAENSLFDLSLLAAQSGSAKEIASATSKITVPVFEELKVSAGKITLSNKPTGTGVDEFKYIYLLNGDGTLGTKYAKAATASATAFSYDDDVTVTVPTGITSGSFFVMYTYAKDAAVSVTSSAKEFPSAGKFVMEVLGCDPCDSTAKIYAYVIFPNAKLDAAFDYTFATDSTHPITLNANIDYCDPEKKLFQIVIPDYE